MKKIKRIFAITVLGEPNSNNYQFGSVNTYFMEAGFRVRTGKILPQNPPFIPASTFFPVTILDTYQFYGYSFEDFYERWKPSDFMRTTAR